MTCLQRIVILWDLATRRASFISTQSPAVISPLTVFEISALAGSQQWLGPYQLADSADVVQSVQDSWRRQLSIPSPGTGCPPTQHRCQHSVVDSSTLLACYALRKARLANAG